MIDLRIVKDKNWIKFEETLKNPKKAFDKIGDLVLHEAAVMTLDILIKGLEKSNLVRPPLTEMTQEIKSKKGLKRIKTPLIGKGRKDPKSMLSSMQVKKIKKGYILSPTGYHYAEHGQKPVKNSTLWLIHEYGALIKVTDKMRGFLAAVYGIYLKKTTEYIKIPARYPVRKALNRFIRSGKLKEILGKYDITEILINQKDSKIKGNPWDKKG